MKTFFVSGIDTDAGKTFATGYLARLWNEAGYRTITQKLVQTGNVGRSEDIERHRSLMGIPLQDADREGWTMPAIFSYPCSPHLAAEIDGRSLDLEHIRACTRELEARYDRVLVEGAGGLMVPLTRDLLTIDYAAAEGWPLIFVTSGRLGSISHTLLALEAAERRGIRLHTLLYNRWPVPEDPTIQQDTALFLQERISRCWPEARWMEVPVLSADGPQDRP